MAYTLLDMAQRLWRRLNAAHRLPLVRSGVVFIDGVQKERNTEEDSEGSRLITLIADPQLLTISRRSSAEIQCQRRDGLCETSSWRLFCSEACHLGLPTTRVSRAVRSRHVIFQQFSGTSPLIPEADFK